ncbi:uncharacterized protein EAE97_004861 [Botrytis byssoidea]|uniref:Uncharacterized protein n=1 Tax=Botrytis byssoidea TaxID=139641 RepID=A0A9P5IU00_9HELO|nr:uncharacterized protein EAE97_004861 [Botrytis byssoidea]KAF7945823.1 hypothetical protein EAE97_004861 [Botrytis byssoidea]
MQYNILAISGTTSQLDLLVSINLIMIATSSTHSDNTTLPSIAPEARVFSFSQILLTFHTSKAQQRSSQVRYTPSPLAPPRYDDNSLSIP